VSIPEVERVKKLPKHVHRLARWGLAAAQALALLAPQAALAQEAAPQLEEDPRAARFNDVERGFFIGFESGFMLFSETPRADALKFSFAPEDGGLSTGFAMGLNAGYDITQRLAVSVFALGSNQRASVSYGAFDVVAAGADIRFATGVFKDGNEVDRVFLYVHARGGYMLSKPEGLFSSNDIFVAGGPGIEYFTRLRHFAIGLAVDGVYALDAGTLGVAVLPSVRYTFK
jgi:hypothetical protein